jgi:hypothetical protein
MKNVRRVLYVLALIAAGFLLDSVIAHAQAPVGLYGNMGLTTYSLGTGTSVTISAFQTVGLAIGTPSAAATYTTDTAANLCALFPAVANTATSNFTYDFILANNSNFPITMAAGANVTLTAATAAINPVTVPPNVRRHFKITLNSCSGSGAASWQAFELAPTVWEGLGGGTVAGPGATGSLSIATQGLQSIAGIMTDSCAAGCTLTTDTAANLCSLTPVNGLTSTNNFYTDWYVKATGASTATLAGGTGVTLVGTGTAASAAVRHFRFQFVNCGSGTAAINLVSLETTAF